MFILMRRLIIFCLAFALGAGVWGFTADEQKSLQDENANFKYHTVATKEGLVFRVPEDMPIEKRGGILAPLPFDEYMYGKFKQMEDRLKRLEAKVEAVSVSLNKKEPTGTRA